MERRRRGPKPMEEGRSCSDFFIATETSGDALELQRQTDERTPKDERRRGEHTTTNPLGSRGPDQKYIACRGFFVRYPPRGGASGRKWRARKQQRETQHQHAHAHCTGERRGGRTDSQTGRKDGESAGGHRNHWQARLHFCLFGWHRPSGRRRSRVLEVGRNGESMNSIHPSAVRVRGP